MSGKRKRTPGMVYIICRNRAHQGTQEWARYGYHCVKALRLVQYEGGVPTLVLAGTLAPGLRDLIRATGPGETPVKWAVADTRSLPLKRWVNAPEPDDPDVEVRPWVFTCCRQNKQVNNARLFDLIKKYFAAFPHDTRVLLPFELL